MIRTVAAALFAVVAGLLLSGGMVAKDARATLLDTPHWVDETRPVVSEPAVRTELSGLLVDGVAARLACRGTLESLLVNSGGGDRLRAELRRRVERAMASPQVRDAWVAANRTAHARFIHAVALDQEPGADRLVDVALLLDVVGGQVTPSSAGSSSGAGSCQADSVGLADPQVLHGAARAARQLHDHRRLPELLFGAGILAMVLSLACMVPAVTIGFAGLAAAASGLGWYLSRAGIFDAIVGDLQPGDGAVTVRAVAHAALDPAFTHQLAIGIAGVVAIVIAAILGIARTPHVR
jgi:hypothetical protein